MKFVPLMAGTFFGLSILGLPLLGQDASAATNAEPTANPAAATAAAIADQQATDEKLKRLTADIENLRAANQAILDKLSGLKDDLQQIRADQARLAASAVAREDLRPLAQRIEEVDKKREEDKRLISDEFKKTAATLEKLLTTTAEPTPIPPAKPPHPADASRPIEGGVTYTIKDGDRLTDILAAYNDDLKNKGVKKRISQKQAMEANPDVDWNHLKIGQKIIIPVPPE